MKEEKKKFNLKNVNFKMFKLESGKSRFWSPVYTCTTPKSVGCTTKKITSAFLFAILLASIIMIITSIISIVYELNTGKELIPYTLTVWFFMLPIFFFSIFLIIPLIVINWRVSEEKILRVVIIFVSVIGVLALIWFVLL
jgi:hypothetical protein